MTYNLKKNFSRTQLNIHDQLILKKINLTMVITSIRYNWQSQHLTHRDPLERGYPVQQQMFHQCLSNLQDCSAYSSRPAVAL